MALELKRQLSAYLGCPLAIATRAKVVAITSTGPGRTAYGSGMTHTRNVTRMVMG